MYGQQNIKNATVVCFGALMSRVQSQRQTSSHVLISLIVV